MSEDMEKPSDEKILDLKLRYYRWFPPEKHLGFTHETYPLDLNETAFVLIDVYCLAPEEKFINEQHDDEYANLWYEISVNNIAPALKSARALGLPIIYLTNSAPRINLENSEFAEKLRKSQGFDLTEAFAEEINDPKEYCQGPTVQLQFPASIAPTDSDYFIRKHVYSGFFDTRLDTLLRNLRVKNLICVGFVADACVFTTIADAVFRNYKVILIRDCTLASELPSEFGETQNTNRVIQWIETLFGTSLTSQEFEEASNLFLSNNKIQSPDA